MGSSFDYDSLAARGFTVAQVADQLSNTTEGADQVNPTFCMTNCTKTVAAVEYTLAGSPRVAEAGRGAALTVLEAEFGGSFESIAGRKAIQKLVESWGSGSRGIVAGRFAGSVDEGHVFNVINFRGKAFFFDGQSTWRTEMSWKRFDHFMLMRTN